MSSEGAGDGGASAAPEALQDRFWPSGTCFGCGPANDKGLRIKSRVEQRDGETIVVARFTPEPHHAAFPGVLNGGIIGALLDCHSNWTAAHHLMTKHGSATPPCTVTSDFHVTLKRPTPLTEVVIEARVVASTDDRAEIEATLQAVGQPKIGATCRGTFVAVKEGHPAFHRW
jgi:acyl-coenzyme A thioesterase PaaI-like protein